MSRLRRNPAFEKELHQQPRFKAGMAEITDEGAAAIRTAAEPSRNTGYFIRHVRTSGSRITFGDPFWHLIEFGSVNNPAYAPIRTGLHVAGLRLDESLR